ncbi:nucleotide pyrophosphatase [Halobacteriales archaeon QS_4_69_225]|nr:MAG: nucleotide pyrophosphatase [Halobacteriales archaeon QS_4_69_225]
MIGKKTIVVGLDGAHFELIEPWIEAGHLPNIERAVDNGVTADLHSVHPPVTSPNWKAYATGKNPGKLGIFWWENVDMNEERVYYPEQRKSRHPEFWEIIGNHSSAGVINVPTTYPPRNVEPFIVAGAPDADGSGYTHPERLEKELEERLDYRVTKSTPIKNQPQKAADEIADLIDLRFRTAKYLLREYGPEFLQVTTFYLNSLHHYFWNGNETLEGWKVVDRHLGEFLDQEYNIVLMSDHGSTEIDTVFHVNTWLEQQGYLTPDLSVSEAMERIGITTERLVGLSTKLGIQELARQTAPSWLLNRIPSNGGEVQRESKMSNLNWKETTALASGQGPMYIDRQVPDYQQVRSELKKKLMNLTGPNGTKVAADVHRGEEVYSGPYVEEAPDLIIEQTDGVHIQGGLGRDEVFSRPENDGWRGENKGIGLFVASGPDFNSERLGDVSILDLAPTMLHLHGCEIPHSLDGKVRNEIYRKSSDAFRREVVFNEQESMTPHDTQSPETDEEVQDRLKDLGYME